MSSSLVESVYMDGERTWVCNCDNFSEDYVGLEGNIPSQLTPSWRPYIHGGGEMKSSDRGL